MLVQLDRTSKIGITLQEFRSTHLIGLWIGVLQNVNTVPNVNDANQSLVDDGIAPHHDLALKIRAGNLARRRIQRVAYGYCWPLAQTQILRKLCKRIEIANAGVLIRDNNSHIGKGEPPAIF